MKVEELCTRDVITTFEDGSVYEAAQLMRTYHTGSIIVVRPAAEGNIPVGILTDRDLVIEIIAQQVAIEAVTLADVMSDKLLLAKESDELWGTLQRMRKQGVRRVPVVNDKQCLVGILSMDDAIELLADELGSVSQIVSREIAHEKKSREAV